MLFRSLSVIGTIGIWFSAFACVLFGIYALSATGKCQPPHPKIIEAKILHEDEEKVTAEITMQSTDLLKIYFIKREHALVRSEDGTKVILFKQIPYFCRDNVTFYSAPTTDVDPFEQYDIYMNSREDLNPEIVRTIFVLASLMGVFSFITIIGLIRQRNEKIINKRST